MIAPPSFKEGQLTTLPQGEIGNFIVGGRLEYIILLFYVIVSCRILFIIVPMSQIETYKEGDTP